MFQGVETTAEHFRVAGTDSAESSELRFITSFMLSMNEERKIKLELAGWAGA